MAGAAAHSNRIAPATVRVDGDEISRQASVAMAIDGEIHMAR